MYLIKVSVALWLYIHNKQSTCVDVTRRGVLEVWGLCGVIIMNNVPSADNVCQCWWPELSPGQLSVCVNKWGWAADQSEASVESSWPMRGVEAQCRQGQRHRLVSANDETSAGA